MKDAVVSCQSLRKDYGASTAVKDVSFKVSPGQIVGILGPNGSGKTTTVECLQGLRNPDAGTLRVLGLDPRTNRTALRRRVGSQLQDSALPQRIRVEEAVRLFSSVSDVHPDVSRLLADWGLTDRRRATFASLSGGEQQRLFVALALVNRPEVVFLDEMTTGLDPAARREAWTLVERVRDLGATVVLVTHFMDEAERLCDHLVILNQGVVVAAGSPGQLIADHGGGLSVTLVMADLDDEAVRALPGVRSVHRRGSSFEIRGDTELLLYLGHLLVERATLPDDIRVRQPSMEDVYFHLIDSQAPAGGPMQGRTP